MLLSAILSFTRRPVGVRRAMPQPLTGMLRPLRLAIVTEYYYPHLGGVCEHVHFFAREARRRGHHVDIITSRIPGTGERPGVIRLGRSLPVQANDSLARITIGIGLRKQMRRALRDGGYDLVHVHSPLTPTLPLLAIEEAEVPVVGTFHTDLQRRSLGYTLLRGYFQGHLDRLDAAIAVSNAARAAMDHYFDADYRIIPNGIDTSSFRPDAPAPAAFAPEVPSILFLGRFDSRNGLEPLIGAYRRIRATGRRVRLVIVGDGPQRDRYHALAGGDPDIVFTGAVLEGRPGYYANATVYACPTTVASFGITLLESMACATPIVCTKIRGFDEVVQHEREALMVPPGDEQALADALARVLDDPGLAAQLGAAGRDRALAYDWSCVTDEVLDVYARLLGFASVAA